MIHDEMRLICCRNFGRMNARLMTFNHVSKDVSNMHSLCGAGQRMKEGENINGMLCVLNPTLALQKETKLELMHAL